MNWHTPSSPTRNGDFVIVYTSQSCAVLCIQVPVSEIPWPIQKYLKFLCFKDINVVLNKLAALSAINNPLHLSQLGID
jgi:hypothetical protein